MTWQPWGIAWRPAAGDDLRRVDRATARRVVEAVERYAATGHGNVIPLKGRSGEWRLRMGDWRIIFVREIFPASQDKPEERRLLVLAIRPRGGAYQ